MHYYQFNIGDYLSHTRHLTAIEDICYRRALDHYYLHEQPLSLDVKHLARVLLLSEYQEQLSTVLSEFFIKTDDGYVNSRADAEIQQYQSFSEAGKRGAAKRWSKGADSPPNNPPIDTPIANNKHKPITNNQEPVLNNVVDLPHAEAVIKKTNLAKIVFDEWALIMNHPKAIMDAKRKRAIDARLKDGYTIDQLKQAILGCKHSEFHQGANDRHQVYDDIELICRTASNVDKFIQMGTKSNKLSAAGQSTQAALERWLGETND